MITYTLGYTSDIRSAVCFLDPWAVSVVAYVYNVSCSAIFPFYTALFPRLSMCYVGQIHGCFPSRSMRYFERHVDHRCSLGRTHTPPSLPAQLVRVPMFTRLFVLIDTKYIIRSLDTSSPNSSWRKILYLHPFPHRCYIVMWRRDPAYCRRPPPNPWHQIVCLRRFC